MSELVEKFKQAHEARNHAWSDEGRTYPELEKLASDEMDTARALVADAADRHHIEERSVVYLKLTATGWVIDTPTWGDDLEGYDNGPLNEACDLHDEDLDDECGWLLVAASRLALPDAHELLTLLQASRP